MQWCDDIDACDWLTQSDKWWLTLVSVSLQAWTGMLMERRQSSQHPISIQPLPWWMMLLWWSRWWYDVDGWGLSKGNDSYRPSACAKGNQSYQQHVSQQGNISLPYFDTLNWSRDVTIPYKTLHFTCETSHHSGFAYKQRLNQHLHALLSTLLILYMP